MVYVDIGPNTTLQVLLAVLLVSGLDNADHIRTEGVKSVVPGKVLRCGFGLKQSVGHTPK